jgi:NhaA family Na+:H+ antiporter
MSLFIGLLAFPEPGFAADVRLGVLGGSLLSATLGTVLLLRSSRQAEAGSSNREGSNEDRHAT